MNIENLAKHLKEFTLDEIEMIAECDCKTELEHFLNGVNWFLNRACINIRKKSQSKNLLFALSKLQIFRL